MSQTPVAITTGTGAASVAAELVSGTSFQQIEVYGGGGASVLSVNPDGSVNASIIGTLKTTISGSASIVSTVPSSVLVGASIFGQLPAGNAIIGAVAASITGVPNVQGKDAPIASITGNPVYIAGKDANGSVAGMQIINGAIIASVNGTVGIIGTPSVSGTVNIGNTININSPSIYGNVSGSVVGFQGGTWNVSIVSTVPSSVIVGASIFGSLPGGNAVIGAVAASISGTVATTQSGAWSASTIGGSSVQGSASVGGTIDIPINMGAKAVNAEQTAVANNNKVQIVTDLVGKPIVLPYANPENFVSNVTSVITGTTAVSVLVAPAAGLRNYVTNILVTNAQTSVTGAGTFVDIKDSGANVLYSGYAAAGGGGFSVTLPTPIRQPTTAASIDAIPRTQASIIVSMSGYKGI